MCSSDLLEGDSVVYQGRSLHVAGWARRFLFRADQLETPVARLSGGEQARILLARLMLRPADILLLDAPICTLHTFANRMLAELGLLADHDPGSRLVTDLSDLAQEVIADCYLADPATQARLEWPVAETIGRAAIAHYFEPLYPQSDPASAEIGRAHV